MTGGSDLGAVARTALADAWQELGRVHGAVASLPGVRLMASGLPHPQWNTGDVDDADEVDVAAVRAWYEARRVPWGLRVPPHVGWTRGRRLFRQRLMVLPGAAFRLSPSLDAVEVHLATEADLDAVVDVDAAAFHADPALQRRWLAPHLRASPVVTTALAVDRRRPIGTAYSVYSNGRAGPALYVAGVGVLPGHRRRGVAAAMSSWLIARGIDDGARWVHLHPDTDEAARVYARLGFLEVDGVDVFVGI
ncbi:MAG TPA: GNAT family N-acetyltransferase [Mycobacteriales bacterium]|nr:GNAT family N-acetyltransferase [Mycobacteriales bacterium]